MALTVQNDDGDASGANAYVSVADFKSYHDDRGNSYGTASDAQIAAAIIRATDYLDIRFCYIGTKLNGNTQATEWPRADARDASLELIEGLPEAVIEACAEYALRALSDTPLNPDPDASPTGARVTSTRSKAGEVEEAYTYDTSGGTSTMRDYPAADQKLKKAGLVLSVTTGRLYRT